LIRKRNDNTSVRHLRTWPSLKYRFVDLAGSVIICIDRSRDQGP